MTERELRSIRMAPHLRRIFGPRFGGEPSIVFRPDGSARVEVGANSAELAADRVEALCKPMVNVKRDFRIYTISKCPYCTLVKHAFRSRGIQFDEVLLETGEMREEIKARYGVRTFPQVFVVDLGGGWKRIGGYEETKAYLEALP
jgi:glutaredoxin